MAERRMFSKSIMENDGYLDLDVYSRELYFYMNLSADDDGFIGSVRKIMAYVGATQENLQELINANYIYKFESGVCCIRHWKAHNYLRSDRYHPTLFQDELSQLTFNEKTRTYERCTDGIPKVDADKVRLDKISLVKNSTVETSEDESRNRTLDEIAEEYWNKEGDTICLQEFIQE